MWLIVNSFGGIAFTLSVCFQPNSFSFRIRLSFAGLRSTLRRSWFFLLSHSPCVSDVSGVESREKLLKCLLRLSERASSCRLTLFDSLNELWCWRGGLTRDGFWTGSSGDWLDEGGDRDRDELATEELRTVARLLGAWIWAFGEVVDEERAVLFALELVVSFWLRDEEESAVDLPLDVFTSGIGMSWVLLFSATGWARGG